MLFRIQKGLNIPITGGPEQVISVAPEIPTIALLGSDYPSIRPKLLVEQGDQVKLGQPLFQDRKHSEIKFVAPASGIVTEINYGERRVIQSVVVQLEDHGEIIFDSYKPDQLSQLQRNKVVENLLASGLWTAFRTRPYSMLPDPASEPHSIFVTTIDTNPLSPKPEVVIAGHAEDFRNGLTIISHLTRGPVYLCKGPGVGIPSGGSDKVIVAEFAGSHPAGLVGTHIHFLDPVSATKMVWHLNYQDVIAIGKLFLTGRLWTDRVIALGGPSVVRPRLVQTRLGINLYYLINGETCYGQHRVISGSVLSGRAIASKTAYLGRYHNQVSVIAQGVATERKTGGEPKYNAIIQRVSDRIWKRKHSLTTTINSKPTAFIPTSVFDRIMPLDILATPLLRSLIVQDLDMAEALGCLELDEEDLALCSYVCPSKWDYGPILRSNLNRIERERR